MKTEEKKRRELSFGQNVLHIGYNATIIRRYSGDLYEIKLESGSVCVDIHDLKIL